MLTVYNAIPPVESKMGDRGPQNGRRGLEMGPLLGYWALQSTFMFFDPSTPSMRKGRDGGEKNGEKGGGEIRKD